MHTHPYKQEKSEPLINSAVQLMQNENRMLFMLQNSTIEEQRGIIQFLTAEGVQLAAIHHQTVTVQG